MKLGKKATRTYKQSSNIIKLHATKEITKTDHI